MGGEYVQKPGSSSGKSSRTNSYVPPVRHHVSSRETYTPQKKSTETDHDRSAQKKEEPEKPYDFHTEIAQNVNEAVKGPGTDVKKLQLTLQRLGRDPEEIQKVSEIYQSKYGETLQEAIRGDFIKFFEADELAETLKLINIDPVQEVIKEYYQTRKDKDQPRHGALSPNKKEKPPERSGSNEIADVIYALEGTEHIYYNYQSYLLRVNLHKTGSSPTTREVN